MLWWSVTDNRSTLAEGAVRSGKSVGMDHAFLDFALDGPPGNLALIGKTGDTIYRNVIEPMTQLFGRQVCSFNRGTRELRIGNRLVWVIGANDERAQDKMRGASLVGAYVDEITTIPESFFSMLMTRLSDDGARLMGTTNPDSPMHWLKRKFIDRAADVNMGVFHFRLDDNPYLPPEYVQAIRAEQTGLWRRRFIEGEWVAAEGAVFDMLDIDPGGKHVVRTLPELRFLRLAIDYGTTNPFAAQLMGVSAEPCLYVAREWHHAGRSGRTMTDSEYVEALAQWLFSGADGFWVDDHGRGMPVPLEKVIIDPSAASFRAAWQRRFQRWPENADNAVVDGIRDTASLLATGRLRFHESCRETLREMSGYSWDQKAQEKGEDKPLKQDDHHTDATRYGVRSYRTTWRHWMQLPYIEEEAA